MANVKITDLSSGTTLVGTELFEAVQSAGSVKLTSTQVKTWCNDTPVMTTLSTAANTPVTVATLQHTTSGAAAAGIGTRLDFECQTSAGNSEIGLRLIASATDVTASSEAFDLLIQLMSAGAPPATVARVTSAGNFGLTGNTINLPTERTIANSNDPGVKGDICWDANFIYVCVATDTWKRVGIGTW
jgi:hypothetical protein